MIGTRRVAAFSGSREYGYQDLVHGVVHNLPPDAIVAVGGWWRSDGAAVATRGVDADVAGAARCDRVVVLVMGPTSATSAAGLVRNPVTVGLADDLTAFMGLCRDVRCGDRGNHPSHGTARTVQHARDQGKRVRIFDAYGREVA